MFGFTPRIDQRRMKTWRPKTGGIPKGMLRGW